ncbi:urease accessory protein UreJ [Cereibacter sphaeroides]|uniref:Urease accessory protein UreJ n=1 Tax=Cereibacter sphaeroides TaxID=1063 RepID=A0AAX1UH35_CERSP|nr:HupE/UreJ family protein [Cereibacter sphaeroides]RHZ92014.1 urease accessory protein UreJ [Cereibacter sphaeroides]
MKKLLAILVLSAAASPALAHTGHGDASGFAHGLLHPILGPDHLLAMLGVGIWSGIALPRHLWGGAATFLAAMTVGAALSWAGVGIPMVETWIVGSVVLAGLLVATARAGQARIVTGLSLGAIATFAACHGHAHATEATGAIGAYLAGFLIATAGLHAAGIGVALATARGGRILQGALGAALAGSGLLLMAG